MTHNHIIWCRWASWWWWWGTSKRRRAAPLCPTCPRPSRWQQMVATLVDEEIDGLLGGAGDLVEAGDEEWNPSVWEAGCQLNGQRWAWKKVKCLLFFLSGWDWTTQHSFEHICNMQGWFWHPHRPCSRKTSFCQTGHTSYMNNPVRFHTYNRVYFFTGPAQKVRDCIKVKAKVCPKMWSFNSNFHCFIRDFAIFNTFWEGPVKKDTLYNIIRSWLLVKLLSAVPGQVCQRAPCLPGLAGHLLGGRLLWRGSTYSSHRLPRGVLKTISTFWKFDLQNILEKYSEKFWFPEDKFAWCLVLWR